MQIELTEQHSTTGPEVWVRVLSNSVVDWPTVEAALGEEQRQLLQSLGEHADLEYLPGWPGSGDHNYSFEEYWCWKKA